MCERTGTIASDLCVCARQKIIFCPLNIIVVVDDDEHAAVCLLSIYSLI